MKSKNQSKEDFASQIEQINEMIRQKADVGKSITLRDIPEKVYKMLLIEQAKERISKGRVVSLESIAIKLLKSLS